MRGGGTRKGVPRTSEARAWPPHSREKERERKKTERQTEGQNGKNERKIKRKKGEKKNSDAEINVSV